MVNSGGPVGWPSAQVVQGATLSAIDVYIYIIMYYIYIIMYYIYILISIIENIGAQRCICIRHNIHDVPCFGGCLIKLNRIRTGEHPLSMGLSVENGLIIAGGPENSTGPWIGFRVKFQGTLFLSMKKYIYIDYRL